MAHSYFWEYRGKLRRGSKMDLTKKQKSAIIGMVLGDGYLQKTGKRNARLRLEHKADHYEYLLWKIKLLPRLFQGKPKTLERIHPVTLNKYSYVRHQSNSSPLLGKIRKLFYPQGKKCIPENLEKLLKDDIAFAIWYYDDGYYNKKDGRCWLYLGKVSKEEAEIASLALKNCFGLENSIKDKKNKGFVLYFHPSAKEKIKNILKKYYVRVMAYKIPS
jgi:hypothetical protein